MFSAVERTYLSLREIGLDWVMSPWGNLAGMTSLIHDLGGRARKGAVLVLHNPGLLGQGYVKFSSRSYVGHAVENWILSCRATWRERRSQRQRLRGHLQDTGSYRGKVGFRNLQNFPSKEARAGSHLPK